MPVYRLFGQVSQGHRGPFRLEWDVFAPDYKQAIARCQKDDPYWRASVHAELAPPGTKAQAYPTFYDDLAKE